MKQGRTIRGRSAKPVAQARPTIKDIAERCGVHPSTVSRALNPATRHLVAGDVAKRIRAAATALDYRQNIAAAGLRTGRSGLIGVLPPDIADPGFPPSFAGLASVLGDAGYEPIVVDVGLRVSQQELLDRLIARGVDGLVLGGVKLNDPVIKDCLQSPVPVVLFNRSDAGARLTSVVADNEAGMRLAVEHLVSLGHRRIGHVAGPRDVSTGSERRAGFEASAARAGLSVRGLIEPTDVYTREAGRLAAIRLLDRKSPPTAIVAANDLLAIGVYDALASLALSCPGDVSVVGYNDMPFVDMLAPPLTTVHIGLREMGEQSARLLLERITRPTLRRDHVVVKPTLMVRSSTAPPRH